MRIEAWAALLVAGCALRLVPFDRVARWPRYGISRGTKKARRSPGDNSTDRDLIIDRVTSAIAAVRAPLPGRSRTCLARALATQAMLARRGVVTCLRIGVKRGAVFAAHAWLETGTRIIGDADEAASFSPLPLPRDEQPDGAWR